MIDRRILDAIGDEWRGTTEGLHLRVFLKGDLVSDLKLGTTYPLYDWASLTKMVLTLTLLMKLVDEGSLSENEAVENFLPELRSSGSELRVKHLLTHTASLPASIHFWPEGIQIEDVGRRKTAWRERLLSLPMRPSERSSYTELDFQVLGYVIEKILGTDIESLWLKLSKEMGLSSTVFHRKNKPENPQSNYAPTEVCPLRRKTIQGEVHHPDIWLVEGLGWLSGLFGPMDDLATWALGVRGGYFGKPWAVKTTTVQKFAQRRIGSSSLGFMMPKIGKRDGQKYYLSCGEKMSPLSIGHTGFTGPMFWFDPERDLIVLILTNRTFPSSANEAWFHFRGILHDRVVGVVDELIGKSSPHKLAVGDV